MKCRSCGGPVEPGRECYAIPTCHMCLPPPVELPVVSFPGSPAVRWNVVRGVSGWHSIVQSTDPSDVTLATDLSYTDALRVADEFNSVAEVMDDPPKFTNEDIVGFANLMTIGQVTFRGKV